MWTRSDYMDGRCSHQEYYQEIAEELGISFWRDEELMGWLVRCLKHANPYFNEHEDVPGPSIGWWDERGIWMFSSDRVLATLMRRGEVRSQAVVVCILKAAAYRDAMAWVEKEGDARNDGNSAE